MRPIFLTSTWTKYPGGVRDPVTTGPDPFNQGAAGVNRQKGNSVTHGDLLVR
jgi:hypothetical protein